MVTLKPSPQYKYLRVYSGEIYYLWEIVFFVYFTKFYRKFQNKT
jgi:hypothetical protein